MLSDLSCLLRQARRGKGYTQQDCARSIGVSQARYSDYERGLKMPTVQHLCTLSVLLGKTFESVYAELMRDAKSTLRKNIRKLPTQVRSYVHTFNRNRNLERLQRNLDEDADKDGS